MGVLALVVAIPIVGFCTAMVIREFRRLREELQTPLFFETPSEGEPRLERDLLGPAPSGAALAASESGPAATGPSPSLGVYDGERDPYVRAPSGPEILAYDLLEQKKEPAS
jgi:hypothetical protein